MSNVFCFCVGVVWSTLLEWLLHRYVLHRVTKTFKVKAHLEHHAVTIKHYGADPDYTMPLWKFPYKFKESWMLYIMALVHLPLAYLSTWLYVGNLFVVVWYFVTHFVSHRWPDLGWRWVPWHMEHHMVSAKKNFGVTNPLWDWLFGTLQTHKKTKKKE